MMQVISFHDKQNWEKVIQRFSHKDVYYFQAYCSLYYLMGDGEPFLAFYENHYGNTVCYPFIKRPVNLPFLNNAVPNDYDIITPYGYGGPLAQNLNKQIIDDFRIQFDEYCRTNNIVSEFIRFNPLLENHQYLDGFVDVVYDRETVYIDLTKSKEEIVRKFHKNHRRNLNKAIKNKLEFKALENQSALLYLDEFYELYNKTMDKLSASEYYYFSREYLKELLFGLNNNSMIAAVFLEEKMIAGALCMYENEFLHYHLGCSDQDFLNLGTNVYQFYNTALWGKQNDLQTFHLGGGHVGRDSLFEFKHRFNQEGTVKFFIGKKIHNMEKYYSLVSNWEQYYSQRTSSEFFPAYRARPAYQSFVKKQVNKEKATIRQS